MEKHVEITTHVLFPNQGLQLDSGENTIVVREGLLYVSLESGDAALIPGDELVIRPGDFRGAWTEGTGESEFVVLRG